MVDPLPTGRITAGFNQMRPLSRPPEQRTHVHGAVDLAAPTGTRILAPEAGTVVCLALMRPSETIAASRIPRIRIDFDIRNHYYFLDIYGGLIILLADSGRTHVITHSYRNQLFNRWARANGAEIETIESPEDERFPAILGELSTPVSVEAGEVIGYVGNAGFSTGPHIHWEIHPGREWHPHAEREDPEDYL